MANAIDYLDWRGDVPLSLDGFNEVDGLIVSKLTSLDFTDIVLRMAACPSPTPWPPILSAAATRTCAWACSCRPAR